MVSDEDTMRSQNECEDYSEDSFDGYSSSKGWTNAPSGMICCNCKEKYLYEHAGPCALCYNSLLEEKEDLRRELDQRIVFKGPVEIRSSGFDTILVASRVNIHDIGIPTHRQLLFAASPAFKAMFETEMLENRQGIMRIADISFDALWIFVSYLYTSILFMGEDNAMELLALSETYFLPQLKKKCEDFLLAIHTVENVLGIYVCAVKNKAHVLSDRVLTFILDNIDEVLSQPFHQELKLVDIQMVNRIQDALYVRQHPDN